MTKIKLCGLRSLSDIAIANQLPIDYVGFVFADSKRKVSVECAMQMKQKLSKEKQAVGVFVNALQEEVVSLCHQRVIDLVQLHGDEDEQYVNILRENIDQPIIVARRVRSKQEAVTYKNFPGDYLLFDSYVVGSYGGTGHQMDCSCIPKMERPIFIAGGLSVANVQQIITNLQPYGVDVSSMVEVNNRKDRKKVKEFVHAVKMADKINGTEQSVIERIK